MTREIESQQTLPSEATFLLADTNAGETAAPGHDANDTAETVLSPARAGVVGVALATAMLIQGIRQSVVVLEYCLTSKYSHKYDHGHDFSIGHCGRSRRFLQRNMAYSLFSGMFPPKFLERVISNILSQLDRGSQRYSPRRSTMPNILFAQLDSRKQRYSIGWSTVNR